MKTLLTLLIIIALFGCSNQEKTDPVFDSGYCITCRGLVKGIDAETGIEITGLNTSEFLSGTLIVFDSENFKPKLAKASESYDINMVIAMVIYQHPDSGIINIFTKNK